VTPATVPGTAAGALMPDRPLSPHLSVYKFKYTFLSSFTNRAAGCALSAALLVLMYWLMALANGAEAYDRAMGVLSHPVFKLIFAGFIFCFVYHFVAGVRHLVWDTGRGLEKRQSQTSAWLVGVVSLVLTLALIGWGLHRMGSL
jgi:succinate dehydrogenase / fumarate reductase, cytochrome b subunit